MSNTRSCEDVIKEDIAPADFGIAESEHQKAIYFAEYMLHRCVVNMQAEIDELRAKLKALEEQKPVAEIVSVGTNFATIRPNAYLRGDEKLYLAAGAKHD